MKKPLFTFLCLLVSQSFFVSPGRAANSFVCDSMDPLDAVNPTGIVTLTVVPLVIKKQNAAGTKIIYSESDIICSRDVSQMTAKPTCTTTDQSTESQVLIAATCNQDISWFGTATLTISKGQGNFGCHLKYPGSNIRLSFKNCVAH